MTLSAALMYAARGWAVFPLAPRSKAPLIAADDGGRGCLDATTDASAIGEWWERAPRANVGIATGAPSGLFVVDVDGTEGAETMRALTRSNGPIPPTLRARTSSGWHLFFTLPVERVRQGSHVLGRRVDTRSTGGYVVAPPSVHPCGARYRWIADIEPAPCPEWVVRLAAPIEHAPTFPPRIIGSSSAVERAVRYLQSVPHAVQGQGGNARTYHAAVAMVRGFALDASTALALLELHFNPRCEPQWKRAALAQKVESASRSPKPLGFLLNVPRKGDRL